MDDGEAQNKELLEEIRRLRELLEESEENMRAINRGEVDAFVITTPDGDRIYTLSGADKPYRILIEDMSEGAATLSHDAKVLYCNNSFASMLRTPIEEIISTEVYDYVSDADGGAFREFIDDGRKGDKQLQGEFHFRTGDGLTIPVYVTVKNMIIDGNRIPYIIAIDMTKSQSLHRRLRESEERFRNSVENMLIGFGIFSPLRNRERKITDYVVDYVNPATRLIVEVEPSKMIGRKLSDVLPGFMESPLMEAFKSVVEEGKPYIEYSLQYQDAFNGVQKTKYIDISAIKWGDSMLLSWRDVTQRYVYEKEIADLHRMESVGRMSAMIAADLRNPLNLISQGVEGIDKYPELRQRMLQIVKENVERALMMIEELRMETREIELNPMPTDLHALLKRR